MAKEEGLVTCGDAGGRNKTNGEAWAAFRNLDPVSGKCMWHDENRGDDRAANRLLRDKAREEKLASPKRQTMPKFSPDTLDRLSRRRPGETTPGLANGSATVHRRNAMNRNLQCCISNLILSVTRRIELVTEGVDGSPQFGRFIRRGRS